MWNDLGARYLRAEGKLNTDTKKLAEELDGTFEREYQKWYTEAHAVIRQLIPDRLSEFEELYKGDGKRKNTTIQTYHIQDWLNGVRSGVDYRTSKKLYDDFAIVSMRFATQLSILKAVDSRFESTLHDIKQLVQADLFDSELGTARELLKNGYIRAAGAIAGVVLEKHLGQVAVNHNLSSRKQHPTISDLNDLLKNGTVLDVPAWRNIQRLGDLRNMCDHNKHRDPTHEEVDELVTGVEKISKTLF
ncbi:MAG: hypothetical protein AB7G68_06235 [Nitrospiraceae bacterium]